MIVEICIRVFQYGGRGEGSVGEYGIDWPFVDNC